MFRVLLLLLLFFSPLLSTSASALSHPPDSVWYHGQSKSNLAHYQALYTSSYNALMSVGTCRSSDDALSPHLVNVTFAMINNDYCDCADGSDEPGTSACLNSHFFCLNQGATSKLLPSSQVNDGVCDCCSGADEWRWKLCPDTCEEEGKAFRESILASLQNAKTGLVIRQERVQQASVEKKRKEAKRDKYASKLAERKMLLDDALAQQRVEEEKETYERAVISGTSAEAGNNSLVNISVAEVSESPTELSDSFIEAGSTKTSSDEASTFPYPESYRYIPETEAAASIEESSISSPSDASEDVIVSAFPYPAEYAVPEFHTVDSNPVQSLNADDSVKELSTNLTQEMSSDVNAFVLQSAESARQATRLIQEKVDKTQRKLTEVTDWLAKDLGSDLEFAFLLNSCFFFQDKQYTYEMCPYASASQKEGASVTNLGSWSGWERAEENVHEPQIRFRFTGGAQCWSGPPRSLNVDLYCGPEDAIRNVEEPSRCVYQMKFETPAVCTETHLQSLQQILNLEE